MQRTVRLTLFLAALAAATAIAQTAQACTIDGKASAYANGRLAVAVKTPAKLTAAATRTWAPFAFVGQFHAHAAVKLTEDRQQILRLLSTQSTQRPWRWEFGDHTIAVGWAVTHRYAHPGTYRISVSAYDPYYHDYYSFDEVRIAVAR